MNQKLLHLFNFCTKFALTKHCRLLLIENHVDVEQINYCILKYNFN